METSEVQPHRDSQEEALAVLRCTTCGARAFAAEDFALRCSRCGARSRIEARIIDCLTQPSQEVNDELQGMMRETQFAGSHREFMIRKVDHVVPFSKRKAATADAVFDYYGSTEQNFHQALARVPITGRERVLEIGAQEEFPFLTELRRRGCICFACNIHMAYDESQARSDWPVRVLGDMHDLPFADESFDLVYLSATSHHGAPLHRIFSEIARVTRPGGWVMNINEPIRGIMKHAFSGVHVEKGHQETTRDELVHEHEYSIFEYLSAFRASNLSLRESLFSSYYDQRLSQSHVAGVRFAPLAFLASKAWRRPMFRALATGPGLWLGQATLGLQMNVVLQKRS